MSPYFEALMKGAIRIRDEESAVSSPETGQ